jgi:hypothetical protein
MVGLRAQLAQVDKCSCWREQECRWQAADGWSANVIASSCRKLARATHAIETALGGGPAAGVLLRALPPPSLPFLLAAPSQASQPASEPACLPASEPRRF